MSVCYNYENKSNEKENIEIKLRKDTFWDLLWKMWMISEKECQALLSE